MVPRVVTGRVRVRMLGEQEVGLSREESTGGEGSPGDTPGGGGKGKR